MWWDGNYIDWYGVAKDFQTLIAGLLGFGGVAVSIFLGGYFQRQQERRRILHEAGCIRSALYAELRVIVGAFLIIQNRLKNADEDVEVLKLESLRYDLAFPKLRQNLGLLFDEEVQSVTTSYLVYSSLLNRLEANSVNSERGEFFLMDGKDIAWILEEMKNPILQWEKTLKILQKRLNFET